MKLIMTRPLDDASSVSMFMASRRDRVSKPAPKGRRLGSFAK